MKSDKKSIQYIFLLILLNLLTAVFGEENLSINETINQTNVVINETINQTGIVTINETVNQTNASVEIMDFEIINLTPKKVEMGDITLNIEIKNTGNVKIENLVPIIIGRGFSTYDTVPIESLEPDEVSHIYVMGNLAEDGDISLNIRMKGKIFYEIIKVESKQEINESMIKEMEEARKESIKILSEKQERIKEDYSNLQNEIKKKKESYDISAINLEDLRIFIRDAESALAIEEVEKANASTILAEEEIENQINILNSAQKKPFITKIRENLLLISTTVGAIVTLFAFYEVLKKKKDSVYKKIKEFKINKDTKIVVEKKVEDNKETKVGGSETKDEGDGEGWLDRSEDTKKDAEKKEENVKEINVEDKEKKEEDKSEEQGVLQEEDILKSDKPLKELFEEDSLNNRIPPIYD